MDTAQSMRRHLALLVQLISLASAALPPSTSPSTSPSVAPTDEGASRGRNPVLRWMLDDGSEAAAFGDGFFAPEFNHGDNAAYYGTLSGGTDHGQQVTFASLADSTNPSKVGWLELYNPVVPDIGCVSWNFNVNQRVGQSTDCVMQYARLPEITSLSPDVGTQPGFSFSAWVHFDEYGTQGSGDISPNSRILWLSDDEQDEDKGNKIVVGNKYEEIGAVAIVTKDGYKSEFEAGQRFAEHFFTDWEL